MFHYLEYSRVVLADISGLNANVFYELGHRHRARETGTMMVRQVNAPIPFDINSIKAFPYEYQPADHAAESVALITRVLQQSLEQNRPDSPVQAALNVQRQHPRQCRGPSDGGRERDPQQRPRHGTAALPRRRDDQLRQPAHPAQARPDAQGQRQLEGRTGRVQRRGAIRARLRRRLARERDARRTSCIRRRPTRPVCPTARHPWRRRSS